MNSALEKKDTISLVNCQVRGARGGGYEIVLTNSSKVQLSPRKFDSRSLVVVQKEPTVVKMNNISSIAMDALVTVVVKVKTVDPPDETTNRDGKTRSRIVS